MKRISILVFGGMLFAGNVVMAGMLDAWTLRHSDPSQYFTGLDYGASTYVVVGQQGVILTSPDGVGWTARDSGTSMWIEDVAFGNNVFVAVGQNGTVLTSSNGISWTPRSAGTFANYNRVRFLNGQFIAVGAGATIATSTNGIDWALQDSDISDPSSWLGHLYQVNFGNGLYIIVGQSNTILTSPDTIHWTPHVLNNAYLDDVAYGNGTFVITGYLGVTLTSPNGTTWTTQSSLATSGLAGMIFAQGCFVGAGGGGTIFSSLDGTNWTQRAAGITSAQLWNAKCVNGTFMAVGESGTILQSGPPSLNDGLVAYYPFNGNAHDESGHGNDGTVHNATLTRDRFGSPSSAFHFDGDSYIQVPDSASLDLTGPLTISAWVKPESLAPVDTTTCGIISKPRSLTGTGYRLGLQDEKLNLGLWDDYPRNILSPSALTSQLWVHLVGVYDGNAMGLYINGTQVASQVVTVVNCVFR